MAPDELAYTAALDELERILERLEHDEPDVDRVASDVARAAELIGYCRERIATARLRVEEVVATLADGDEPADSSADRG
jgi:exodeoxyribonuclease VII small subunit